MSLIEKMVKQLTSEILIGKYPAGSKLPTERELAARFGVGRPTAHGALKHLEEKGFVRIMPRHGCRVLDFRKFGRMEVIDAVIHQYKEDLEPQMVMDLYAFIRQLLNDMLGLCVEKRRETHCCRSLLSLLSGEVPLEGVQESDGYSFSERAFAFYHELSMSCGNFIYPLMLNQLKGAFVNTLEYLVKPEQRAAMIGMLMTLCERLGDGDAAAVLELNNQILGMVFDAWHSQFGMRLSKAGGIHGSSS